MPHPARLAAFVAVACLSAGPGYAGDWPTFRGPEANGTVPGPPLPVEWDGATGRNVRWSVPVAGEGWSQPVIVGEKLFLTAAVRTAEPAGAYRYEVRCLDAATGEAVWTRVVMTASPPLPRHRTNTYATETPVTDGQRVYALFGMTALAAFTLDGEEVWTRDLEPRQMRAGWGTAASPALHGGRLFLQVDNEEGSFLRALDAAPRARSFGGRPATSRPPTAPRSCGSTTARRKSSPGGRSTAGTTRRRGPNCGGWTWPSAGTPRRRRRSTACCWSGPSTATAAGPTTAAGTWRR